MVVVAEQAGVRTRNSLGSQPRKPPCRLAAMSRRWKSVPRDITYSFTVREERLGEQREVFLVRMDGGVRGWMNHCRHFTGIKIGKGDGAPLR